ncbi:hypothetical protein G6F37_009172 [Rhizopus arrhizus]|nr:hypothetical protein G6F38_009223 [Rhizopus arrhizus]KAG1154748.1 hypothetical protein G6F37_009172 [Rhizopus arrhizus]
MLTILEYIASIRGRYPAPHLYILSVQQTKAAKAIKIINGITVHVLLKEVRIPNDARDGSCIAEYLTTIISLAVGSHDRIVTENYEKLKIMTNAAKEDNLVFTKSMPDNSFRDNSPTSSQDSTSSDESQDLEDIEREIRIMKNIEAALREFQDHSQKKCFDCTWDEVINLDDEATSAFFFFIISLCYE